MSQTAAPPEVLFAFVRGVNALLDEWNELLVPVLRGSLLLQHWFGDLARPAGDIDFECFAKERTEPTEPEDEEEEEWRGDGFGRRGEYESLVDLGKGMCRYAALYAPKSDIEFEPCVPPDGSGASLWVYGTPGERYFAGWTRDEGDPRRGVLQIDIAAAGYPLADIAVAPLKLTAPGGKTVACPAYTPEALLAAKFSWLVRSTELMTGTSTRRWKGELKDVFDAHLLLTQSKKLRPELFQKSLLAMGGLDQLAWNYLDTIFTFARSATDADFSNWKPFAKQHADILPGGPAEMLREIADRIEPLLGDFYLPDELPFFRAINADPADETAQLVYADWLADRGSDARAAFMRHVAQFLFHNSPESRLALKGALERVSQPWLASLFGTSAGLAEFRTRLAPQSEQGALF